MKKVLSILLTVLLCAGSMTTVFAVGGTDGNITWNYNESTKTLTISGTGDMPDYYNNSAPWSSFKNEIEEVVIQNGVTSISEDAFYSCSALKTVTISESVADIGSYAFGYCGLQSIVIPNKVRIIHADTFYGCRNLKDVTIPNGVTAIAMRAFRDCSAMESLVIPKSVEIIACYAFYGCDALNTLNYAGSEEEWQQVQIGDYEDGIMEHDYTVNYNYGAPVPVTVTLIADEGGTVSGGGTYLEGEAVTVTATPNPGYHFVGWFNGDSKVNDNASYSFAVTGDMTLTARFEQNPTPVDPGTTPTEPENLCPWCGGDHSVGLIQMIIGWFHGILANIFGARY